MTTRNIYDQALERMREFWPIEDDWVQIYDNAALWFANEVQSHYENGALIPCSKDVRKKEAKLSFMKDLMLIPDLWLLSDRCQKFAWETGLYAKDENGRIPKENDHALDCARYILSSAGYDEAPEEPPSTDPHAPKRRAFTIEEDMYNDNSSQLERQLMGDDYE